MKEFEYKVGDYVYCYKDCIFSNKTVNKSGNTYRIKNIEKFYTLFNEKLFGISIIVEKEKGLGDYYQISHWHEEENYFFDHTYIFYDHFLSKEQYRKFKLGNLNEQDILKMIQ